MVILEANSLGTSETGNRRFEIRSGPATLSDGLLYVPGGRHTTRPRCMSCLVCDSLFNRRQSPYIFGSVALDFVDFMAFESPKLSHTVVALSSSRFMSRASTASGFAIGSYMFPQNINREFSGTFVCRCRSHSLRSCCEVRISRWFVHAETRLFLHPAVHEPCPA